jgi:hypothetical protein
MASHLWKSATSNLCHLFAVTHRREGKLMRWPQCSLRLLALVATMMLLASGGARAQIAPEIRETLTGAVVQISLFAEAEKNGEVQILLPEGRGSGTVVSPNGFILTNHHVLHPDWLDEWIEGEQDKDLRRTVTLLEDRYAVLVSEGERPPVHRYIADVVKDSADLDLALLQIVEDERGRSLESESLGLPFVPLADSDGLSVFDPLYIIGFPGTSSGIATTQGTVSGFSANEVAGSEQRAWILVDAVVSGGNSGGAAVDTSGRLVGITSLAGELECRRNAEEARDCVPIGGSLASVRPINLAYSLLAPVYDFFAARGVEDDSYINPTFRWGITWNSDTWQVRQVSTEGEVDSLQLNYITFLTSSYPGDPRSCLNHLLSELRSFDRGAIYMPYEGEGSENLGGDEEGRAWAVYTVAQNLGTEVLYMDCRSIELGKGMLTIFYELPLEQYEARRQVIDSFLSTVRIPGNRYTSRTWGYSISWNTDVWKLTELDLAHGEEILSFTSGPSAVRLRVRGGLISDIDACVERVAASFAEGWELEAVAEVPQPRRSDGAWAIYAGTLGVGEDATTIQAGFQCRELIPNKAILEIWHITIPEAFDAEVDRVDELLDAIVPPESQN